MMKTFISLLLIVAAGVLIFLLAQGGTPQKNTQNDKTSSTIAIGGHDLGPRVDPSDHVEGNPNATVVLIEYSDFQCPACKLYYPVVRDLSNKYKDNVAIVFRHYPLVDKHKNALATVKAAEAAGKQGKFWEMSYTLFDHQEEWSVLPDPTDALVSYAQTLELNTDTFKTDLNDPRFDEKIANDVTSGDVAGLTGTPTFVLNGRTINARTVDDFSQEIDKVLKK